jgi:hypothetical protein
MARTERKSRDDLMAMGDLEPHIPRNQWEYDQIDGALKPLDALASEMEARWGVGRLQELVTPATAAKWQSAKHKLDLAIADGGVGEVIKRAGVLMRGWQVLEQEAMDAGNKPMPVDIWIASVEAENGKPAVQYAIAKNNSDASLAQSGLVVYTLPEVARIIRAFNDGLLCHTDAVKAAFPKAVITDVRPKEVVEDDVPF